MKKNRKILLSILLCFIIFLLVGLDPRLETTEYIYQNSKIPASFDNYKICQISDLHCKNFGNNNQTLINAIQDMNTDIVVLTGDIVDEDHTDLGSVESLFSGLENLQIPTYYITGNHEFEKDATKQYAQLQGLMNKYGVTDLDGQTTPLSIGKDSIYLTGGRWYSQYITQYLKPANPQNFNILLYHGADFFDLVSDYNYDLVLSGHIHGGVIRLPFLNKGLLSNTGEFFPQYVSGFYQNETKTSTMIVSRGLGDSIVPRFYNRPELVLITLKSTNP